MDCIIRVISGTDAGLVHRLQPGANLIGRSANADLRLTPLDISFEHAVITRSGDEYLLENLSASGTYVGDAKVAGGLKLRPRDEIRLSKDTVLRFETLGGGGPGLLSNRWFLGGLLAVVMVLGGLAVTYNGDRNADNWYHAYYALTPWIQSEVQAKRLPPAALTLFQEGWRLEEAMNYDKAMSAYLKLQLLLDSVGSGRSPSVVELMERHPRALQRLLTPAKNESDKDLSDEEATAATYQFVKRRLAWNAKKVQPSRFKS